MKKNFKTFSAAVCIFLSVTFTVAAISGFDLPTFESAFVQSLKVKFIKFHTASQDRIYLQTDKTFYKPGETIWFSAYLLDEHTLHPSQNSDIIHVEFITPKGTTAKHYKLVAKNGSAQGDFDLTGSVGGIYKIKAYTEFQKNDTSTLLFEKEITVQNVVMPRLKMKLDFGKKAYGKGDEVTAKLELIKNDNTALANAKVKFAAQLDGKNISENSVTTDAEGKVNLKFFLPKDLNSIDGIVNAMIDFEGTTESISRSIPIVLNQIALEFFPEGGDLVSNVNSKLAFCATNEFGKPADVEGIIVDSKGVFVQKFSSFHSGMGAVNFTPQQNETYKARITKPEGILTEYELPEALKNGYVLRSGLQNENNLQLSVFSWNYEELSLVAQTRGKIYYAKSFNARKGENQISIPVNDFPIGVSQITLFDSKGIARCERLAFLNKDKQLNISITADKQDYQPREKVSITIKVTDENGLPVPGNFSMSVVDDNLLAFADDKQGNILSKILLEPELKEKVEEANFYFDKKEKDADRALDNLLLTSGWRHYTWKQITDEEIPMLTHIGEKAELSGIVYDGYTGKPVSGAQLKLKGANKTTITDKDGKFSLRGFDISRNAQMEITATNYSPQTQTIYNYEKNQTYYLYDNRYYSYRFKGKEWDQIPMAQGGAMQLQERQVIANGANKAEKKNEEELFFDAIDAALVPDVANDVETKKDEKTKEQDDLINGDGDKFIAGNVGDIRLAEALRADKNANENNAVVFYRAKEFPKRKFSATDTVRNDFASTVYWNGNIVTDRNGRAKVDFVTNDLISSFKASLEGFGDDGSIGRGEMNYSTNLPFSMDVKIPTEMVSGDKMMIPVFLKNTTHTDISGTMMVLPPKQLTIAVSNNSVTIPANTTKVVYLNTSAANEIGNGTIEVKFTSKDFKDDIKREVEIVAKGFPANISLSGQDLSKEFYIHPVNVVPNSMKVSFTAYPNIMSELMSGVDAILREPYGCFEQTSSSNYPNIMVMQYLKTLQTGNPKIEERAKKLLDDGYKKLASFETKENGYEWFGAAPAHEALTAYGLMEFVDMKNVYAGVDDKMIERTVKLLLDKRDGNGGFKKNPRALDSFGGADEDVTNCYIVWAMTEAGRGNEIEKEVSAAFKTARKSNDPYLLALMANAMFNIKDDAHGEELVNEIVNAQQEAGFWNGKKHSITRSTGNALKIETTSLVALALMKSKNTNIGALTSAIKFLVNSRSGYGMFGSTQSTILALKALSKYAEFSKKTDEAGTVQVLVNNVVVGEKSFEKGERNNIEIKDLEKFITQGKQKVEVRFKGCNTALPYSMNVNYSTTLPESSKQCVVNLETKISAKQVKVGETLRLSATLKNKTSEGQPMTLAIIGIPAGFSAQPWQLKEMQEKGVIDFYEIIGNNIACYYRALAPNAEKQINLDLKAEIPGEYDAPASSAYLYYTNENKDWAGLERVLVNP